MPTYTSDTLEPFDWRPVDHGGYYCEFRYNKDYSYCLATATRERRPNNWARDPNYVCDVHFDQLAPIELVAR